jgi:hypothetical protein
VEGMELTSGAHVSAKVRPGSSGTVEGMELTSGAHMSAIREREGGSGERCNSEEKA